MAIDQELEPLAYAFYTLLEKGVTEEMFMEDLKRNGIKLDKLSSIKVHGAWLSATMEYYTERGIYYLTTQGG